MAMRKPVLQPWTNCSLQQQAHVLRKSCAEQAELRAALDCDVRMQAIGESIAVWHPTGARDEAPSQPNACHA